MKSFFSNVLCLSLFFLTSYSYAQVGIGTSTPNNKSILDITSSNKGVLLPRFTTSQRNANLSGLTSVENGLLIFNTETGCYNIWNWNFTTSLGNWASLCPEKLGVVDFSDCNAIKVIGIYSSGKSIAQQAIHIDIPLKVTSLGSYYYTALVNGITFSALGVFTSIGVQTVSLTPASGTPTVSTGTFNATLVVAPTLSGGTTGITCNNIPVSFLSRSNARLKIVNIPGVYTTLTPSTTYALNRVAQWLTGVVMADQNNTPVAHTAIYYAQTAGIDIVTVAPTSSVAVLSDALETASIVYVGGDITLSQSQANIIAEWWKSGRGYIMTNSDDAASSVMPITIGYYVEAGSVNNGSTINTGLFPQLFSQTAPYDAPYAIQDGLNIGYQGGYSGQVSSNSGKSFVIQPSGGNRIVGFADVLNGAFIFADKFGAGNSTTDQSCTQLYIDLFAYMLKNAPVYTSF